MLSELAAAVFVVSWLIELLTLIFSAVSSSADHETLFDPNPSKFFDQCHFLKLLNI